MDLLQDFENEKEKLFNFRDERNDAEQMLE